VDVLLVNEAFSKEMFHDMFHDMLVHESGLRRAQGTKNAICFTICLCFTICFTICLFISPDLDGHDMFHDMFVHHRAQN
jgi:hypothetical protein